MYQKTFLIGNLGRDPEMRYNGDGRAVTNFSLATEEKWPGADGKLQKRTTWWRVAVWGKPAEACNEFLSKGSKVFVEGRMVADPKTGNPRTYQGSDGETRASFEITALLVKFLDSKGRETGQQVVGDDPGADDADTPF